VPLQQCLLLNFWLSNVLNLLVSWRGFLRQKNMQASGQAPPPDFCAAWTGARCELDASVMYSPCLWRDYRSALDGYEQALRGLSYPNVPVTFRSIGLFGLPAQSLPANQIETLLHIDDRPHGYQLIQPAALPVFPTPPLQPADQPLPLWRRIFWAPPKSCLSPVERQAQVERASKLQSESEALRLKFATQANRWVRVKQDCKAGEPEAIKVLKFQTTQGPAAWTPNPSSQSARCRWPSG
jgi:hypothetical protein